MLKKFGTLQFRLVFSFGKLPKDWTTRFVKGLLGKHPLGKNAHLFQYVDSF